MLKSFKDNELWKKRTPLCDIMEQEKSDKSTGHNYTTVYNYLFEPFKNSNITLLEVGLGTNNIDVPSNMGSGGTPKASVRGWNRYFKNGTIHGADIDKRILIDEETPDGKITTHFIDQLDLNVITEFKNKFELGFKFDVIIDDGLHTHEANINLFEYLNDILKIGGLYIIEDCNKEVYKNVLDYVKKYDNIFDIDFITIPHANTHDNRMIILKKQKDFLICENKLSIDYLESLPSDNEYNKYFDFEEYKINHNKKKVFSMSLFNNDVNQDEEENIARINNNFEEKYKKGLFKLLSILKPYCTNDTNYGINLFCDEKYKNLIDDPNVNIYSFKHSFGNVGMFWRHLSLDFDIEETIIFDIDLDDVPFHKKFIKINDNCRLLAHGKNDFYVDTPKTAKKYTSILGSSIKFKKESFSFNMKDTIKRFLYHLKNNIKQERQNIYNHSVGTMINGFGNNPINYGSDERFLGKVIYYYLVEKGQLTTFFEDKNNYENKEDIDFCKRNYNNVILF
tara:strand:+ start:3939 stop:5462 length:1524 start_codon:yes stop_codon:yes gene_type:complete